MNDQPRESRTDLIERKIDRDATRALAVSLKTGGVAFTSMLEIMESAKLMAVSGPMVPQWLQGNVGGCWAVILQSVEWGFSPLAVARMSYEVNNVVSYMSQLVHAVIEARARLAEPLDAVFTGEGLTRACKVVGKLKLSDGNIILREYQSPLYKDISPKNSPLWKSDPDQQLWYFSSRAWCRRWQPHVLMGIYAKDEIDDNPTLHIGAENAKDVTPAGEALHQRLKDARGDKPEHSTEHAAGELDGKPDGEKGDAASADPKATVIEHDAGPGEPEGEQKPKRSRKKKGAEPQQPAEHEALRGPTPELRDADMASQAGKPQPAAAAPEPRNPGTVTKPRTSAEYVDYAKDWMDNMAEAQAVEDRFGSKPERQLRADCGVMAEDLDAVRAYKTSTIAQFGGLPAKDAGV